MRLPKIRQLTEEQKKVYLYAPTDKHVLVQGPPGTGKTLIACLRAIELRKKNVPVMLGMFNRVLAKYSSNALDGCDMPSQTVQKWFYVWWGNSGLPPHPNSPARIAIQADFEQNDHLKAAGARWYPSEWRPWQSRRGVWMVDNDTYFRSADAFNCWRLWHKPPVIQGKSEGIDWGEVAKHIIEFEDRIPDGALDLGTLLIDEGHDFPPGFYKTLRHISAVAIARGARVPHPPRCFILADENQQITENNSTLQEIAETLRISEENRYLLLDNFRNSREIAELARRFFDDVGALPRQPLRSTEKPAYSRVADPAAVVATIKTWVTNNPGKEVGVLVFADSTRSSMVSALRESLSRMRGRQITVQTYSWNSRQENKVDDLIFDSPDVVTVLNMQSCKGLEFDAVFIVDLHEASIGIYGTGRFKMQMFVAVSRAREWVNLVDSGDRAGCGQYYDCLPGPEYLERDTDASAVKAAETRTDYVVATAPPATWEKTVAELAAKRGLVLKDLRSTGGCFWVSGGSNVADVLEPLGFRFSEARGAWWKK